MCFGKFLPAFRDSHQGDSLSVAIQMFGGYVSASLVFVINNAFEDKALCNTSIHTFHISINSAVFQETCAGTDCVDQLRKDFDFLKMQVSPEEHDRLLRTCRACVRSKKRYNYRDVLLYNVPFRDPIEKTLFQTETLHDTQSVILILRECLGPEHPVIPALKRLHSRTTMPSLLYEILAQYLPSVELRSVVSQVHALVSNNTMTVKTKV